MGIKQSSIDRQRTEFGMDYLTMIDTLEITSNKSNLHIKTDLISKLWLSRPSPEEWSAVRRIVNRTINQLISDKDPKLNELLEINIPLDIEVIGLLIAHAGNKFLMELNLHADHRHKIAKYIFNNHHKGIFISTVIADIYASALMELSYDGALSTYHDTDEDLITYEPLKCPFYACSNTIKQHCYNQSTYRQYLEYYHGKAIYCPLCKCIMQLRLLK